MTLALDIINSTYREVLPGKFNSEKATGLLTAIGFQESGFLTRVQNKHGPARSFWQFERVGVAGVLMHPATAHYATAVCNIRRVVPAADAIWQRMEQDDLLGCAFARLLLYRDPRPLPEIGQRAESWEYYVSLWQPGKADIERWASSYSSMVAATSGRSIEGLA